MLWDKLYTVFNFNAIMHCISNSMLILYDLVNSEPPLQTSIIFIAGSKRLVWMNITWSD